MITGLAKYPVVGCCCALSDKGLGKIIACCFNMLVLFLCCSVKFYPQVPEIGQIMLQMNAMSAQLGFVSTQLSQLLLADRPATLQAALPSTAAADAKAAESAALVPAGQKDMAHALETIEARLVLMETRMQRLECLPVIRFFARDLLYLFCGLGSAYL